MHPEDRERASEVGDFNDGVSLGSKLVPWFGPMLFRKAHRRLPPAALFAVGLAALKSRLEEAMGALGLQDPSLHCCRHGGAS
eukprot:3353741-Alexandrium_andersonii.AAC.1